MSDLTDVGRRIKQARKALGLEQSELAGQLGVSVRAVAGWETGEYAPERENLRKLAVVLGRSPRWIMEGEDEVSQRISQLEAKVEELERRLHGDS